MVDKTFDYLDAPIKRVTAPDTPVPFAPIMENFYVPDKIRIIETVKEIIG
jgi:pyruvate dehydrogenase E1 component beta subunit